MKLPAARKYDFPMESGEVRCETGHQKLAAGFGRSVYLTCFNLLLISIFCVLSRLPFIYDPHGLLQIDECVSSLMAEDLLHGHSFSIYVVGQHYGLAIIETLICSLSFVLHGVNYISVKYAMLGFFITGCYFYYLAGTRLVGPRIAVGITLLLVFMPPWLQWSMQYRPGYLTAFVASALVIYLALGVGQETRWPRWLELGVLVAIVFLAQRLWIPGLVPVVLVGLIRSRSVSALIIFSSTTLVTGMTLHLAGVHLTHDFWHPEVVSFVDFPRSIFDLLVQVPHHLGSDLFWSDSPDRPYQVVGAIWSVLLFVGTGVQVWRVVTKRLDAWSHILFLSVCGTLAYVPFLDYTPRYLLPLSGYLLLWLGVEWNAVLRGWPRVQRHGLAFFVASIIILVSVGIVQGQSHLYVSRQNLKTAEEKLHVLIEDLKSKGIRHVYTPNYLIQQHILFYSRRTVLCRSLVVADRTPQISAAIDRALYQGQPVAIITYAHEGLLKGTEPLDFDLAALLKKNALTFLVYDGVTPAILKEQGFELSPSDKLH